MQGQRGESNVKMVAEKSSVSERTSKQVHTWLLPILLLPCAWLMDRKPVLWHLQSTHYACKRVHNQVPVVFKMSKGKLLHYNPTLYITVYIS